MSDIPLVSEIRVEGDICDGRILSAVIKDCKGSHQSIAEAYSEKHMDSFVVGQIIEEKKGSHCRQINKFILREVPPNGDSEDIFALFSLGKITKELSSLSVKVNDFCIIHEPEISKSCLIHFLDRLDYKYELQVIVGQVNKNVQNTEKRQCMQLIRSKESILATDETLEKASQLVQRPSPRLNSKNKDQGEMSSEYSSDSTGSSSPVRKIKRLYKHDSCKAITLPLALVKGSPRHAYTRLKEVNPLCNTVNIIGIIVSVEPGCQSYDDKNHLKIHLQDESTCGKNFILNLVSNKIDIPPLHDGYILRAHRVLVLSENDNVVGWVRSGKLIATVDSDLEKPPKLLTTEDNPNFPDEDKDRIMELCKLVKVIISKNNPRDQIATEKSKIKIKEKGESDQNDDTCSQEDWLLALESSDSEHATPCQGSLYPSKNLEKDIEIASCKVQLPVLSSQELVKLYEKTVRSKLPSKVYEEHGETSEEFISDNSGRSSPSNSSEKSEVTVDDLWSFVIND